MKIVLVVLALLGARAEAAGFEKNVLWSGKHVGIGGAAASSVAGSEALLYNPAGLAQAPGMGDVAVNFSPTFGHFKGPIAVATTLEESDESFSPVGGLTASYNISDRFGIGLGYFVTGGTKAVFEDVALTGVTGASGVRLAPKIQSVLSVTEFSVGAAYELVPGLSLGAAWRTVRVNGEFYTASAGTTPAPNFTYVRIDDMKDTRYDGFRVGAQLNPAGAKWGVGATYRNNVDFEGAGTSSGQFALFSGTTTDLSGGPTTLTSSFPWQASLGAHYDIMDELRAHLEFTHTNYSRVRTLLISGPIGTGRIPSVSTNWRDQNNYRLGFTYSGLQDMKLRAGYVLTTKVVPNQAARATFSSPASGHTVTAGAGFGLMQSLSLDGALEYSFSKGKGESPVLAADYSTTAYVFHLGTTYSF